ncbi:unnamed protein product, partial [Mesorhabditis spiculigera]
MTDPTIGGIKLDLDALIVQLLTVGTTAKNSILETVKQDTIAALCSAAKAVFISQPSLIEVSPPIRVCGDTHGQYDDVLRMFDKAGFPPKHNYIFLGDYVDRGSHSLENIALLFCFKVKYPENFFLLRGNHECSAINKVYGFYAEIQKRCSSLRLWYIFQDVFNCMPLVGLIGGRILCMHGGLSPRLTSLDQLRKLERPIDPPNPSLQLDLMWADPELYINGWQSNNRGVSYSFGADVCKEMCAKLGLDLVARAHQVVEDGYLFFADRHLVTIFSVAHYCGSFQNKGAVMCVDSELKCSFLVMAPDHKRVILAATRIKSNPKLAQPPKVLAG